MKSADTKPPKQHPVLRRLAYVGVSLVGIVVGFCLFSDGEYRYRVAQNNLEGLRSSIKDEERMDEPTYTARFKKFSEDMPALLRQLPDAWPKQEIEQEMLTLASRHGIAAPLPKVSPQVLQEFWVSQQYELEMHGSAEQLFGFLTELTHGDAPLRRLKGLALRAEDAEGKMLVATFYLTYFRWLTAQEEREQYQSN